jgi:choice-of-anchor A domain-containing protein
MPSGATVTGHAEVPEDFTAERVRLKSLSERLAGLGATGTVNSFWGTLVLSGDEVSDIQIFDITGRQAAGSHTVFVCNIPDDATIIVNIDGEETGFDHMTMWSLALCNNRVLFNFHEATTLRFVAVEVQGSVLAPRAAVNSMGGVIFGTAIARSWDGPMCFGNEPFRGTLPECE